MTEAQDRLTAALSDRYRIERELGQGGMATVYLAEDLKHRRKVAIKVLRPELAAVLGVERFLQEIELTANLQHPHILTLYDSGQVEQQLFYVMPYIDGESLADRLARERQLSVEEAVRITREVADALDYAHRHGVVHRDIKPANVLLQDGRAMVADFGIARAVRAAGADRLTGTGLSLGTPGYMSPEQAAGDREIDGRSDQFSLGCMAYEMLVGEPPHAGPTVHAVIARLLADRPKPPTATRPSVPAHVEAAILRALEKLPADRFASAAEFGAALVRQESEATIRTPVASERRGRRWNIVYAVLGGVALVAAGFTLARMATRQTPVIPDVSRVVLDIPEAPRQLNEWGRSVYVAAGRPAIVYEGPGNRLWRRPLDSLGASPIAGSEGVLHAAISPDGGQILIRTGGWVGALYAVPWLGGSRRLITDSAGAYGEDWSDDGHIYFSTPALVLARVADVGGSVERLTSLDTVRGETFHGWAEALPGGRGVVFTVGHHSYMDIDSAVVAVLDLRTGRRKSLLPGLAARYVRSGHLVFARSDGVLRAVPFDLERLELAGEPVVVAEGVSVNRAVRGADFDVSPDGHLAFVRGAHEIRDHFLWVSRTGSEAGIDSSWPGRVRGFALSMDGRRLAVSLLQDDAANNVWLKDLPTGQPSRFSRGTVLDAAPSWSPDGKALLFAAPHPPQRLDWDLYTQGFEGSPESLLVDGTSTVGVGVWSPDGARLVWTESRLGTGDILSREFRKDARTVPVAASRFSEYGPSISPDSRWLAYVSDETGRAEVYVRSANPAVTGNWQVSDAGGTAPRWARSGRELFFVETTSRTLISASVETVPRFRVVSRRALFSVAGFRWGAGFEVAPGDQRFVFVRRPFTRASGEMVLVQNFAEELRRRVKPR